MSAGAERHRGSQLLRAPSVRERLCPVQLQQPRALRSRHALYGAQGHGCRRRAEAQREQSEQRPRLRRRRHPAARSPVHLHVQRAAAAAAAAPARALLWRGLAQAHERSGALAVAAA